VNVAINVLWKKMWKDQIHRSQYLKDYYKGREGNSVFKKCLKFEEKCFKCGARDDLKEFKNKIGSLEIEYYLCPKHRS